MAISQHHVISMMQLPRTSGCYIFDMQDQEISWTQEEAWLLLVTNHVGVISVGARTQAYQPFAAFIIAPGHRCQLRRAEDEGSCTFWGRFVPAEAGAPTIALPAYSQLGEFGSLWFRRIRMALNRTYQMRSEMQIVMADLLWFIGIDPGLVRQNPALHVAEKYIEASLGSRIRIDDIAQRTGVSHNQLIRIFQEEHGVAPLEFIRHRRQNLACRLLLESSMPVKQIAAAVGMSDLSQFNRLVHGAAGMSPTALRATIRPANLFRS